MSKQKYPQTTVTTSSGTEKKRNTLTIKKNGYSQNKNHAKKVRKQREADIRQADYDTLTIAEKISLAVKRGGSKRELARLARSEKHNPTTIPATVEPTVAPKPVKAKKPAKVKKS